MRIDLAVPSYKGIFHPRHKQAMDILLGYSRCSCFEQNQELATEMYAALAAGKKFRDLPPHSPYHHPSDCPLGKHDIYAIPQVLGYSVIHWARNNLLMRRRAEADYVLFCDDDIVLCHDALEQLLSHKKDIIAPLCTKRADPPEPVFRNWSEPLQDFGVITDWPLNKLVEVDAVGTGVLLLSRQVIEDVAINYHPRQYRGSGDGFWFEFLKAPSGGEWGEDMSFCFKAKRLGYRIFVDTSITPQHQGDYGFSIDDFLAYGEDIKAAGGVDAYRVQEQRKLAVKPSPKPEPELESVP